MYPKIVKRILMKKSAPHPLSKRTPTGGKMMAKKTLQISEQVSGITKNKSILLLYLINCKIVHLYSNCL